MVEKLKFSVSELCETLKGMTFSEKREYIWEYYKLPILGMVIILYIIGSIINGIINPPPKTFIDVSFTSQFVPQEILEEIVDRMNTSIVTDPERYTTQVGSFFVGEEDPQVMSLMGQKFYAMLTARDLDILIMDVTEFEDLADQGALLELTAIYTSEELSTFGDLILSSSTEDNPSILPYGIQMKTNAFLGDYGFPIENFVLSIAVNTARQENVKPTIDFLFER